MKIREEEGDEFTLNMTPMIDVVFLMIIFFICIEFKVLESKLNAFLPTDKGSQSTVVEPQEQLSIKIHVERKGTADYGKNGPGVNIGTGTSIGFCDNLKNRHSAASLAPASAASTSTSS